MHTHAMTHKNNIAKAKCAVTYALQRDYYIFAALCLLQDDTVM